MLQDIHDITLIDIPSKHLSIRPEGHASHVTRILHVRVLRELTRKIFGEIFYRVPLGKDDIAVVYGDPPIGKLSSISRGLPL